MKTYFKSYKKRFKKVLTRLKIYAIIKYRKNKKEKVELFMTKLQELMNETQEKVFNVNGVKIKQTERNDLKNDTMNALEQDLTEIGLAVGRTEKGIVIALPNENEGVIYATVDTAFKHLDYDPQSDIEDYQKLLEERAERERKRAEKRAKANG